MTAKKSPAKKAKASPKKVTKKTANKKAPANSEQGIHRSKDVKWTDNKVAILKALKTLKATSKIDARSIADVADKANLPSQITRHYLYHAQASGIVVASDTEDVQGFAFSLTAKGSKMDFAKELKAQNSK